MKKLLGVALAVLLCAPAAYAQRGGERVILQVGAQSAFGGRSGEFRTRPTPTPRIGVHLETARYDDAFVRFRAGFDYTPDMAGEVLTICEAQFASIVVPGDPGEECNEWHDAKGDGWVVTAGIALRINDSLYGLVAGALSKYQRGDGTLESDVDDEGPGLRIGLGADRTIGSLRVMLEATNTMIARRTWLTENRGLTHDLGVVVGVTFR